MKTEREKYLERVEQSIKDAHVRAEEKRKNFPFDLTGRKAKCCTASAVKDSDPNLAFFQHRPEWEHDIYYCGCRGWD